MTRIYFQHGGTNEEFMKKCIIDAAINREIEVKCLINDDSDLLGTNEIDLYLLHCSEVSKETILKLRKKNPQSLIYGIFGGGYVIPEEEKRLFDRICSLELISSDDWHEVFSILKKGEKILK